MLNKIFKHGSGGASGVMNYMLKDPDNPKLDREGATVLRGDVEIQAQLIDSLVGKFKQQYVSGCWSFEEAPDQVTDAQKNEIMDGTERLMFAGLDPDRVSITWIEHTDKGRLELNYIVACVDLEHGRLFQPYMHSHDQARWNAFKDIQNITHGFTDPNDPAKARTMSQTDNLPRTTKELKEAITAELESQVIAGLITNRDDVKQALSELGYTITRAGKDYISIKNPDPKGRNIKFKSTNEGGIYDIKFNASAEAASQISRASEDFRRSTEQRLVEAQRVFERELERKSKYHDQRHGQPMRASGKHERQVERSPIKHERSNSRSPEILPRFNAPSPFSRTKANESYSKRSQDSDGNRNARAQQFNHDNYQDASTSISNISPDSSSYHIDCRHPFWTRYSKNINEVNNEQAATRSSQSSDASAAGNDSASVADAQRQGSRYSRFERFIEKISASANRESGTVTRALSGLERVHTLINTTSSGLVTSTDENTKQSADFDERTISTSRESDKINKSNEELSERIATLDDLEGRSGKLRERITAAEPFTRNNQRAVEKIERHIEIASEPKPELIPPEPSKSKPAPSPYTPPRPRF